MVAQKNLRRFRRCTKHGDMDMNSGVEKASFIVDIGELVEMNGFLVHRMHEHRLA